MVCFFPPKDYDKLLVDDEIDLSIKGIVEKYEFRHKYTGNYSVGVLLKNFSAGEDFSAFSGPSQGYNPKLRVEIKFYVNGSVVLSKLIEKYRLPFLGPHGNGLIFASYKTPQELPIDKTIVCEVKIIEPDENLTNTYGHARFFVRKESDE